MAKIIIGGEEYEGDLETFVKLEEAWPHISKHNAEMDVMEKFNSMLRIVAAATGESFEDLKSKMKRSEMVGLAKFFAEIMKDLKDSQPGEAVETVKRATRSRGTSARSTRS